MTGLRKRWKLVAIIAVLGVLTAIRALSSGPRITLLNARAVLLKAEENPPAAPLDAGRLVLLELEDFGYSISARGMCDVLSYHFFAADKDALFLTPWSEPPRPLVIRGRTQAAINIRRSSTEINDARHPFLIDRIPWAYASIGAPLYTDSERFRTKGSPSILHLHLVITRVAADGAVTLATGRRRVLLKPGGEVKLALGIGKVWRSTVTIRHAGVFDKARVKRSKWLRVEED